MRRGRCRTTRPGAGTIRRTDRTWAADGWPSAARLCAHVQFGRMTRLDDTWRREHWWDRPDDGPSAPPYAEAAIVAGVAISHVVDHLVVPRRFHLATHLAGAAAAVGAAAAAGATLDEMGLRPDRFSAGLRHGAVAAAGIATVIGLGAALPPTRTW